MKGVSEDLLNFVLTELLDQAIALGVALQRIDGLGQGVLATIPLAGGPKVGARPAAQRESHERINAGGGDRMAQRRVHAVPSPAT